MIWTIAQRQLLEYLLTWRFSLVLAVSTVLVVLGTMLQVDSLEQQLAEYDARQNQALQQVQEARTYNEVRLPVGRRPSMLAFLCAGQDRDLPHFATAGILAPPVEALGLSLEGDSWFLGYGEVRPQETLSLQNPLMEGLSTWRIDFVFVVATFLSLLALLLSFDSIAGERETGTLPIVLANAVGRGTVLLGKWLGGVTCLALALAVALNAALIVGLQSPRIAFGAAEWGGVGLLFAASLVLLAGLFALGMAVSSRTSRSSTALVILLLVWTVAAVLVPSGAPYVAFLLREVPSEAVYASRQSEQAKSLYAALREAMANRPAPVRTNREFVDSDRLQGGMPYAYALRAAPREAVDWYSKGTEEGNLLIVAAMDRSWDIYDARFTALEAQRRLADVLRQLSPVSAYTTLAERITGTHADVGRSFARQARRFYDLFVDVARREGGLGQRFFAPLPREEYLPLAEYQRLFDQQGYRRVWALYEEKRRKAGPLQALPAFLFHPAPPLGAFLGSELTALAILGVLFLLWGYLGFVRREEAGRP